MVCQEPAFPDFFSAWPCLSNTNLTEHVEAFQLFQCSEIVMGFWGGGAGGGRGEDP